MNRFWKQSMGLMLALVGGMSLTVAARSPDRATSALAAEAPYSGTWNVTLLSGGKEITLWLIKVEEKEGSPRVEILSSGLPNFKNAKVGKVGFKDGRFRLIVESSGLNYAFVLMVPKGTEPPKILLGYVDVRGQHEFARMERTDDKEADPKKAVRDNPEMPTLVKAAIKTDAKEKEKALVDFITKNPDDILTYQATLELLPLMAASNRPAAEMREKADKAIHIAATYGPEMALQATVQIARQLVASEKMPAVAVEYAQKSKELMGDTISPAKEIIILQTLAKAFTKIGKTAEAKPVIERVTLLNNQLDQEFIKNAIPFKPDFAAAPKGKNGRVVLLELFTGAQCPPCVSADVAFDALVETYKPADLVLLQYHLHIPGPDPLTNPDSENRSAYYSVRGTPYVYLNGKEGPSLGGYKVHSKERYETLLKDLAKPFDSAPTAKLELKAQRSGEKIAIQAHVADVKKPGESVRLRLVLVEEVVRYAGRNGQRLHHHVVRAFPGGVEGIAVKESSIKQDVTVNLGDLTKSLQSYLDDFGKKRKFLDDDRPMNFNNLKVVAFIQDDDSKEVLQTVQVDMTQTK